MLFEIKLTCGNRNGLKHDYVIVLLNTLQEDVHQFFKMKYIYSIVLYNILYDLIVGDNNYISDGDSTGYRMCFLLSH